MAPAPFVVHNRCPEGLARAIPCRPEQISPHVLAGAARMRFADHVALITGGSHGIGRAVALRLAEEGARVAISYSRLSDESAGCPVAAEQLRREIADRSRECLLLEGDLGEAGAAAGLVRATLARFDHLDLLVCNAGICPMHDFLSLPMELYDRVHAVNLRGHFACCQEAARHMIARGRGGRIIAITSVTGTRGGPLQTHYASTKSGLHSLIQGLAVILGPHGITCNSVAPGEIDTELTRGIPDHQATWARLSETVPMRRVGRPEDVAGLVAFLASREAEYITGQQIVIDGGGSVLEL